MDALRQKYFGLQGKYFLILGMVQKCLFCGNSFGGFIGHPV
jgi:hypothetical protein